MSQTGPLILTSTNAAEFRATLENTHLRHWLHENRPDMTADACRQVTHHARRLLDMLGGETAPLVEQPPERIRTRLRRIDLPAHGLRPDTFRHLLRAATALHAAVHDLDTERTKQVMDRRTPQNRPSTGGTRPAGEDPLPSGDLLEGIADARLEPSAVEPEAETSGPVDPRNLSEAVRPFVEAVNHTLTAQLALDDEIDVRAAARAALEPLSASAILRIAAELPHAAALPVPVPAGKAAPTPVELAVEAIVAVVDDRHADLRPA